MSFKEDGYEIVDLGRAARFGVSVRQDALERMLGPLTEYRGGDVELHAAAAKEAAGTSLTIALHEMTYFHSLLGLDTHIQRVPFLRISRPGIADDNIGLHRDTWYGDTPYEISVWIPFTDTDEGNALRVAPGSHIWSETTHPVERFAGSVEKGSLKHSLGFIHGQPKRLESHVATVPLPVRVGQMIVFSLALLHGQEINRSTRTRVSMDFRMTNSFAPVQFSRSRDPDYYMSLSASPIAQMAWRYYEAQKCST